MPAARTVWNRSWPAALAAVAFVLAAHGSAAPLPAPLVVRQEPLVRHLLVPGERVEVGYRVASSGVDAPTGVLYVKNDRRERFVRLPLRRSAGGRLSASVPTSLVRGGRLLYYATIRDPAGGRSATVPATGARAPTIDWVLDEPKPRVVNLGAHRFGHTRAPNATVVRAGASAVGFDRGGNPSGPQTFLVAPDRSVWLVDSHNQRLLMWARGKPNLVARTIRLPHQAQASDLALGPAGTFFTTWWNRDVRPATVMLDRVARTGRTMWTHPLASEITNSLLRVAPDGRLVYTTGMPGGSGGERQWASGASAEGRALGLAGQRSSAMWTQPLSRGLGLVTVMRPPYELRFALVDHAQRVVRSWRVVSRTALSPNSTTSALVGGDPVVCVDVTAGTPKRFRWEYLILRLGRRATTRYAIARTVFGDNLLADVRITPAGHVYRLGSSPSVGVRITRFRAPAAS